jgi:putative component of membrane protein insertase Oxa1/YidC/SpoIIIJ protein YidD
MLNIIFIYHKNDQVTERNWKTMSLYNSSVTPVSDDISFLPKTWVMKKHKIFVPDTDRYWNCDTKVYNWTINNRNKYDKNDWHCIVEWDTLIETNLESYFSKYLKKKDTVWASEVFTSKEDPNWMWWGKKPPELSLMAIRPFSLICITHKKLLEVSMKAYRDNRFHNFMNNECRFGSIVSNLGISALRYDDSISKCITWTQRCDVCRPISHPVKEFKK